MSQARSGHGCMGQGRFPFATAVLLPAAFLAVVLSTCTSSPDGKITQMDSLPPDLTDTGRTADADSGPVGDVVPSDATELRFDFRPYDADLADTGPACEPGTGCFLDPCTDNEQCLSGWCVEHLGEGVCTTICQEECPVGWECQQYSGSGRDLMFACVSLFTNLCKPCSAAADCMGPGGVQDACVAYPDGTGFCGGACGPDVACPDGFACKEVMSSSGAELIQCVPESGECACSAKSIALGLGTVCKVENELGTCLGKRICTAEGLSPCDALEPAKETCNGLDDDCDGQTDEPLDDGGDTYGKDGDSKCLCAGVAPYTALVGGDCADGAPLVNPGASESCSTPGDDNCDGKVNDGCIYLSCKELLATTPGTPTGKYDFTSGLTPEQAKLFGFTLRGWDDNASCFPDMNENSAISLLTAECCWVNGIGNNTCCNGDWGSHDQSLLKKQYLVPFPCNPAKWPCSPGGVTVNAYNGGNNECYDASCKVPWARMYVR